MASRRTLVFLTGLCACLAIASVGVVVHTGSDRDTRPAQQDLARDLAVDLSAMHGQLRDLASAPDIAAARDARQDLARTVLDFDQDVLALSEAVTAGEAAEAVDRVTASWRGVGLDLADLAAGEFGPASAAGREAFAGFQAAHGALQDDLTSVASGLRSAGARSVRLERRARAAAVILGGVTLLLALGAFWPRRDPRAAPPRPAPRHADDARHAPESNPALVAPRPRRTAAPFDPHHDLTTVGASVDRVSVDMLTVARSTERMQTAVDSVVSALQGMLFSLNEMSQDTHEGARITRTANNAAVYAADTARDLLTTAREMSDVMARVRQLGARSQEVADRIQTEAAQTGATGAAFSSVVAHEVKQLAGATSQSTAQIEAAVDEILANQRQYENSIGDIIRNVSSVRKVAAHLGELMLEPPARVQPGPTYQAPPRPPAPRPAAAPVYAAPQPQPQPQPAPEPQMAPPPPPPAPAPDAAPAPEPMAEPAPQPTPPPAPEPVARPEPEPAAPPAPAAAPEAAASAPPAKDDDLSSDEIDELAAATDSLLDELADVAADSGPAPAAEPEPGPPAEAAEATAEPEPEPEPAAKAAKPNKPSGSNNNVFMLNKPKKAGKPAAPAPEPEPEPARPEPEASPEPVALDDAELDEAEQELETVPAGPPKKPKGEGASGNIFMLNKPKK